MRARTQGWALLALALVAVLSAGCRQDMHDQPRYEALEASSFFADATSARAPVDGTVARGELREDSHLYRGLAADGTPASRFPFPVTDLVVERGRQRYDIFCSPCHSRTGDGLGMIVRRGFKQPTSFHDPRLQEASVGYLYNVISNGFGQMSSYASQIPPHDRWAVVAYLRALQLSGNVPAEELTEADRLHLGEVPAEAGREGS